MSGQLNNPLRGPDAPAEPYNGKTLISESDSGTRHPARFETTQSTVRQTQMDSVLASHVSRVGALNITTLDIISWDTKNFDEKGLWNGTTDLKIPHTGKITGPWLVHALVTWPGTGAGVNRQIEILQDGVAIARMKGPATTTGQEVSTLVWNPVSSTIYTIRAIHDAGGVLAMTIGSPNMFFELHHPY